MTRVEQIETQVKELRPDELSAFREWFAQFDAEIWDRQMEADVVSGRLDALAVQAVRDHKTGNSTKL